jgi:phosphate transport system substrate-binding protein
MRLGIPRFRTRLLVPVVVGVCAIAVSACGSTTPTSSHHKKSSTAPAAEATGNPSSTVTLNEAGSSLLYPYLAVLSPQFHAAYSNVTLNAAPGGSGLGISEATAGLVQMGGSDAYLSPADIAATPGLVNIPIAVSSQAMDYNVAGAPANLKLTGNIVAQMYEGKITEWNDPKIAAINPGVTLPAVKVIPVRRVDSSGDTFIFTSFLTKTNTAWANGPAFGTTVTWPAVSDELTATGNPGMIQVCSATPGCIAYIGVSVENTAIKGGLKEALLQNKAGNYLVPDLSTDTSAVTASAGSTPANLAQSLIYSSGANSYPIVNFEYLVLKDTQASSSTAEAMRTFLDWAISPTGGATGGNLAAVNFVALPAIVVPKVKAAIDKITG